MTGVLILPTKNCAFSCPRQNWAVKVFASLQPRPSPLRPRPQISAPSDGMICMSREQNAILFSGREQAELWFGLTENSSMTEGTHRGFNFALESTSKSSAVSSCWLAPIAGNLRDYFRINVPVFAGCCHKVRLVLGVRRCGTHEWRDWRGNN